MTRAARYKLIALERPRNLAQRAHKGGLSMFKRTRLISVAAVAALIVSGTVPAMAATPDHAKKKVTHTSKPASKSTVRRAAPGGAPAPSSSTYESR
jgi:hypothetical protein